MKNTQVSSLRRSALLFSAILIPLSGSSNVAHAAAQGTLARPSGSFLGAKLPNEVKQQNKTRDTVVGDIQTATASSNVGDAELSISASSLPTVVTTMTTDNMLYRKARTELIKNYGGSVVGWSKCKHRGYECRKLKYATSDGRKGLARFYLHDDTLVVVNAVYQSDKKAARRFLASAR